MYKDKLGRLKSDVDGYVYCDGIVIDNVNIIAIDYADDEIILYDKDYNESGVINCLDKRNDCIFVGMHVKNGIIQEFEESQIIKNGKVVI